MTTFGFRLRFLLPKDSRINQEADTLEMPLLTGHKNLVLQSLSGTGIKDSNNLKICGSGFSSETEARGCARLTKNSLILCSTRLRIGVDVGKDEATSGVGRSVRERARERGVRLLNDVHGLTVYPEDMPVRFVSASASVVIGQSPEKFVKEFERAFELSPDFTEKKSLAFELYGASHFESSLRARFLTLISAVESLSSRNKQSKAVIAHLRSLIDLTQKEFKGSEKNMVLSQLGNLKTESISSSCRKLVQEYLGAEEAQLFNTCNKIRNELIHAGKPPEDYDLGTYVPKLDELVSRLLVAIVTRH